jgi:hypothetical protein
MQERAVFILLLLLMSCLAMACKPQPAPLTTIWDEEAYQAARAVQPDVPQDIPALTPSRDIPPHDQLDESMRGILERVFPSGNYTVQRVLQEEQREGRAAPAHVQRGVVHCVVQDGGEDASLPESGTPDDLRDELVGMDGITGYLLQSSSQHSPRLFLLVDQRFQVHCVSQRQDSAPLHHMLQELRSALIRKDDA